MDLCQCKLQIGNLKDLFLWIKINLTTLNLIAILPKNMVEVIELEANLTKELEEEFDGDFEHEEVTNLCDP